MLLGFKLGSDDGLLEGILLGEIGIGSDAFVFFSDFFHIFGPSPFGAFLPFKLGSSLGAPLELIFFFPFYPAFGDLVPFGAFPPFKLGSWLGAPPGVIMKGVRHDRVRSLQYSHTSIRFFCSYARQSLGPGNPK